MLKPALIGLMFLFILVLGYLIYLSIRLMRRADQSAAQEKQQQRQIANQQAQQKLADQQPNPKTKKTSKK